MFAVVRACGREPARRLGGGAGGTATAETQTSRYADKQGSAEAGKRCRNAEKEKKRGAGKDCSSLQRAGEAETQRSREAEKQRSRDAEE